MLSGCWFNSASEDSAVKSGSGKTESANLIPGNKASDYQMLRPKSSNTTRGYIQYGPKNLVDMDQLETGLMDLSKDVFSPNDYVFQMGQYLTDKDLNGILYRKGQEPKGSKVSGLNPALGKGKTIVDQSKDSPKYINYVLEQDYMKKEKGKYKLAGLSIAVSLNSVYADNINYNNKIYPISVKLSRAKVEAWGKAHAQQIVQRIRSLGRDNQDQSDKTYEDIQKVPIFLSLYIAAEPQSYVPGDFFAKTVVNAGSSAIGKWTAVDQQHVLFPSDAATKGYKEDLAKFNKFKNDVQKYYPNYVGVIGKASYQNKDMNDLTININFNKFVDESEMIGFTNYVTSLVKNRFPFTRSIPVHIYIASNNTQEALIERTDSMDDPYVHLYQH
nr:CamS family sex pheromone protein [Sporolactobacillus mangiferae]